MLHNNILSTIGRTPLVRINNLIKGKNIQLYAKLESFNPGGSVKDRISISMIREAQKRDKLKKGSVIVEPTSGNTGIGLAMVAAVMGFRIILVMPETMSIERRKLLIHFGAELFLTPGSLGMKGAIQKAHELVSQNPKFFMPMQFENWANPRIHFNTTGPEIWKDSGGQIDMLVAGVGTGGTISGVGQYLKKKNPKIKIVAVEPYNSSVLSGGSPGPHKIQGIGAGFIPPVLDKNIIDLIVRVKDDEVISTARKLARKEGLLVGISSGAAVAGALEVIKKGIYSTKYIVAILPDTGERYLTTDLFNP